MSEEQCISSPQDLHFATEPLPAVEDGDEPSENSGELLDGFDVPEPSEMDSEFSGDGSHPESGTFVEDEYAEDEDDPDYVMGGEEDDIDVEEELYGHAVRLLCWLNFLAFCTYLWHPGNSRGE